jgi:hypothetical protein
MKEKLIIIWLVLLTVLIFWMKFLPQLIEVWEFKHYKFGGWTTCMWPNEGRVVEARNETDFSWLDLDWQLYTTLKNPDDCSPTQGKGDGE